jgi:hypothetical protein
VGKVNGTVLLMKSSFLGGGGYNVILVKVKIMLSRLLVVISQKVELLITTAVRTSNPVLLLMFENVCHCEALSMFCSVDTPVAETSHAEDLRSA